ncbi:MAG: NAD(P)/FAD-dependent oxidoreductase [Chloroflexi bacterium]|nr:NAD(P)/FAD-dependent oxidoreductase [Chloroflexota bacterium]
MTDILVVGGGPIGCYTAYLLARAGLSVDILEEHHRIGKPDHCTGIVGKNLFTDFDVPESLIHNRIKEFKVYSPSGIELLLPAHIEVFALDRPSLDLYLATLAQGAGARLHLETCAKNISEDSGVVTVTANQKDNKRKIKFCSKVAVLATGALSKLPYQAGLGRSPDSLGSVQVEAEVKDLNGAEIFLGRDIAPGSFAYAVGLDEHTAKIGVISRGRSRQCFENLLEHPRLKPRIIDILTEPQARRMPLGHAPSTVKGHILSVGDAAGQVKSTTGGGLYYGLKCATLLAETIIDSGGPQGFSKTRLAGYEKKWKRHFGKEIFWGKMVRDIFSDINDDQLERLVSLLNSSELKNIVNNTADYDSHQRLIIKVLSVPGMKSLLWDMARESLNHKNIMKRLGQHLRKDTEEID